VFDQDLTLTGELEPGGLALEQSSADLAFQRRHLVGDEGCESASSRAARENE
jgi:hypothetical protein